jgi:hypothetical protein
MNVIMDTHFVLCSKELRLKNIKNWGSFASTVHYSFVCGAQLKIRSILFKVSEGFSKE